MITSTLTLGQLWQIVERDLLPLEQAMRLILAKLFELSENH
jgi:hypothetical protein